MVKGTSRQVILVRSPEPKLFEQAIFILREDASGITEEALLQEAKQVLKSREPVTHNRHSPLWALGGAAVTGLVWLATVLI